MSSLQLVYGVGTYAAGESQLLIYRSDTPRNNTRRGILCFHGHGGYSPTFTPSAPGNSFAPGDHARALADAGYIVLSIDAGGVAVWGNDASMTAVSAAYTWLTTTGGAATGKIGLVGYSMGGNTALNWAKRNASSVGFIQLFAPALDLNNAHSIAAYTNELDIAYTGQSTTASGSGTLTTSSTTLNVVSTTGFASSGTFAIGSQGTDAVVNFTGKTGTSFTGCTLSSGTFAYVAGTLVSRIGDYATNSVGHSPISDASFFSTAGIPITIYHGTADSTADPANSVSYVSTVNNSQVILNSLTGAGHTNLFGYFSTSDTARNFKQYL